jgi:hypothetical protein
MEIHEPCSSTLHALDLKYRQTERGSATPAGIRRMRNVERGVTKSVRVAVVRGPEAKQPEGCWFVLLSILYIYPFGLSFTLAVYD